MNLKHLKGNIYAIKGKAIRTTYGTPGITANSIFIDDDQKAVIDPAADKRELARICREHQIDFCFLTHAHLDHVCSLQCFPGAKVYVHRDENATLDGISYNMLYSRHFAYFFAELWKNKLLRFKPHERFNDMQTFTIGKTLLQVIHAPGHTRGHSFFYFPNERILYSGDFDLSVMGPSYSYMDSSVSDMLETGRRLKNIPVDIWVSGHWRYIITQEITKKIDRFVAHIEERDQRLLERLQDPTAISKLTGKGIALPESIIKDSWLMQAMEKKMIEMHLQRLKTQNKVRKTLMGRWVRLSS